VPFFIKKMAPFTDIKRAREFWNRSSKRSGSIQLRSGFPHPQFIGVTISCRVPQVPFLGPGKPQQPVSLNRIALKTQQARSIFAPPSPLACQAPFPPHPAQAPQNKAPTATAPLQIDSPSRVTLKTLQENRNSADPKPFQHRSTRLGYHRLWKNSSGHFFSLPVHSQQTSSNAHKSALKRTQMRAN
jgi:hypothetical protein